MKILFSIFLLLAVIITAGCIGDNQNSIVTPTSQIVYVTVTPTPTLIVSSAPVTVSNTAQTYNIGESASNKYEKVTVNSIEYQDTWNGPPSHKDYKYVLIDITVENLQKNEVIQWSDIGTITDADGYTYELMFSGILDHNFEASRVQPGEKRRGKVVTEIPKNIKNPKYRYTFYGGDIAVYNMP